MQDNHEGFKFFSSFIFAFGVVLVFIGMVKHEFWFFIPGGLFVLVAGWRMWVLTDRLEKSEK